MRFLIVNGFPSAWVNGVTSYTAAVLDELRRQGVEVHFLGNRQAPSLNEFRASLKEFRAYVAAEVARRFDPRDTVIEAPEVWAPTALLGPEWRVHVRLHCPGAVASFGNGGPVDPDRFADELAVTRRAAVVSSPSKAMVRLLASDLDVARIRVFPNPPPFGVAPAAPAGKDIDLLFMARFSASKGANDLQWLLPSLPPGRSVALLGRDFERFGMPHGVCARVAMHGFDPTPARFDLLRRARALLVLSRFENGPMVVLEALAHGTPVVGWDVGGIGEMAGPPLVNLVPWNDRGLLLGAIEDVLQRPPPQHLFAEACTRLRRAYLDGWADVTRALAAGVDRISIDRPAAPDHWMHGRASAFAARSPAAK